MNANHMLNAVMNLDLQPIKIKLMHVESGEGWSQAKADAVEKEYRRFLGLMKLYPDEDTAPLVDVDTFWHYHILDTAKYAADCASAFGYFLHHYPYLGLDGAEDEASRDTAGARMHALYAATFGVAMSAVPAETAWCGRSDQPAQQATAWCGRSDQPAQQDTAWCGRSDQPAQQATAWCGRTDQPAQPAQAATAWCGATTAQPAAATAWCGAATAQNASPALAWCGAATVATAQAGSAWCGAAQPASMQVRKIVALADKQAA